ncbi:MAG TPA: methyl-accepting chemotaxis protein [Verrucomicrobiae bacterium]|jgi:methyl-accepting chemotaxis protein|nr:methyl-accepting chemotaxis protein [Verrucomicrobiae bacterium]
MKNWTIGQRIASGFACLIIIVAALGVFAHTRLNVIAAHSREIADQAFPSLQLVLRVQKNVVACGQYFYQHIESDSRADMDRLEGELNNLTLENSKDYQELAKLVPSGKGHELYERALSSRAEYLKLREEGLAMSRQLTNDGLAYQLARTKMEPVAARYNGELENLAGYIRENADAATKGVVAAVQSSKLALVAGFLAALAVGTLMMYLIVSKTTQFLIRTDSVISDGAAQVAQAAGQVSASSQTLASGSGQQAASLEETSASLEEMSSMTKRNSESAAKANQLAKEARDAADKGASDMQTMSEAMLAIKASSDDIAKIIKTIDEIAFQTNILALNAAVEAARAGDAGMGFAVVADEVRNLAQRSALAAKETAGKIEGAITKTAQGVEISSQVALTLNDIVSKVRQVDDLVAEVSHASREQTQGISQINTAVNQMDKVTQGNAASAEESAAAAEQLTAQSESMKHSVAELMQLVGASSKPSPSGRSRNPVAASRLHGFNGNGNGHARTRPELVTATRGLGEMKMDESFKDF